jgi:hypothetical protein
MGMRWTANAICYFGLSARETEPTSSKMILRDGGVMVRRQSEDSWGIAEK